MSAANLMSLRITTPEKVFFDGDAESLVLTIESGEMGVLADHAPLVVALETAPIRIKHNGNWQIAALSGAFAQIKNSKVVIIADTAEWPDDIELARAIEDKKRAEELLQTKLSEMEYYQSQIALQKALTRIKAKSYK